MLDQGITRHVALSFGTVVILTGVVVLLLWIPLRQRPGIGTVSNVIGLAADAGLALLAEPGALWLRLAMLVGGVGLTGFATAAYIGAGLGPGPRDGLMTAWVRTRGGNVRTVRTTIQVAVTVAPPAGPQSAGAAAKGGLATLPDSAGRPVPSRAPV